MANHRWLLGHIAKPTHKTAKITKTTQADNRQLEGCRNHQNDCDQ
jgi:hypothetical protein